MTTDNSLGQYEQWWDAWRRKQAEEEAARRAAEEEAARIEAERIAQAKERERIYAEKNAPYWAQQAEKQRKTIADKKAEEERQAGITEYLEANPQSVYSSFLQTFDPRIQNYYRDRYYDFYNEYQGLIADELKGGATEQTSFANFLKNINLPERYNKLTNYQRGFVTPRVAPRTRFLTGF